MMASNNWNDWVGKVNRRENIRTNGDMKFHFLEFCRRELSWLVQDVFGNRQFSRVMKKSGGFNCFDQIRVGHTKSAC